MGEKFRSNPEDETPNQEPQEKYSLEQLGTDGLNDIKLWNEGKIDTKEFARRKIESLGRLSKEDKEKLKQDLAKSKNKSRDNLLKSVEKFSDGLDGADEWAKREFKKL
jgi:hypothetical protein